MKSNDLEFENPSDNRRKTGRLYRREITKKKDAELKHYVMRHYHPSAGWCDFKIMEGVPVATGYLKYPRNSKRQKYMKRLSNKRLRRGDIPNGSKGQYRRALDYWWELD